MRRSPLAPLFILLMVVQTPVWAQLKVELKPKTIGAFEDYIQTVEAIKTKTLSADRPFLWIDRENPRLAVGLRRGDIVLHQFKENTDIPGGLIHDWMGTLFISNATAQQVLDVLQNYDRHKEIYPEVIDSKLLKKEGNQLQAYLRLLRKKVLTVVLDSEYEVDLSRVSDKRWYLRSLSTRITQIEDYGEPTEKELPVGKDGGFLWRLNTYWKLEETDDGVLVECNAVGLSRDIPWGLGWMIKPYVESMPKESLEATLQATRLAILN